MFSPENKLAQSQVHPQLRRKADQKFLSMDVGEIKTFVNTQN